MRTLGTRVCGLATLFLIAACAIDLLAGLDLHLSVQMSLILALASFLIANLRTPGAALSLALAAAAVAAVGIALHFYILLASPTNPGVPVFKPFVRQAAWIQALDAALACAPIAGLAWLTMQTRRAALATA